MPPFKTLLRRSLYKTFLLPDKSCGSILLNIIIIGSIIFPILGSNLGHSPLSIITFRYLLFVNIGHQMISSMFNVLWHLQRKFLHFQLPSKVHQELQYLWNYFPQFLLSLVKSSTLRAGSSFWLDPFILM